MNKDTVEYIIETLKGQMYERDHENLEFILTATPHTLKKWYEDATEEDINYVLGLFRYAKTVFYTKQKVLDETLYELDVDIDSEVDCTEANLILSKFRL